MLDAEQIANTTKRYEERAAERAGTKAKIKAGDILDADEPERVRTRLLRKGLDSAVVDAIVAGAPRLGELEMAVELPAPALDVIERIMGKNDLISSAFLTAGARVSRSVCRIAIGKPGGLILGFGTGVLVSPRLVLTNNHVLGSAETAATSQAEFGYEEDESGKLQASAKFPLDPDTLFLTDPELDYTLVAVRSTSTDGRTLSEFGAVTLIAETGKAIKGESVNIIQHPNGDPKRLALRENQIVDLLEDFMHYETDTAPGSSGSPVFNDEWEMVALHHSGVPARNAAGNILANDDTEWTEEMGEARVKWIANEGARVSRLVRRLRKHDLSDAQKRLLEEAISSLAGGSENAPSPAATAPEAPVATSRDESEVPMPANVAVTAADGTATWSIPLHVSVRFGAAALTLPTASVSPTAAPAIRVAGPTSTAFAEALADLERGRTQEYYDEAADGAARAEYYRDLPGSPSSAAFFAALHDLLADTHSPRLKYAPSRHVYPIVDLQPNRMLRSIYTAEEFAPETFIEEDFRIEQERAARFRERLGTEATTVQLQEALDLLEAQLPFNCEHVVPQSWYEKREPMRGDLHHLFACEGRCNSFRGNTPFFEFPEFREVVRRGCGKTEGNRFEPSHGKGPVARATLYFLIRHPGEINRTAEEYEVERIDLLRQWHAAEPVTVYERHRNASIVAKQGNRNPFIDHPEWVEEVDFAAGLGSA